MVTKKARAKKDDGLFITRAMRRDAEALAQAELITRQREADDATDAGDLVGYNAKYPDRTPEQSAAFTAQSTAQALIDARKKFKVDRTYKPSPR